MNHELKTINILKKKIEELQRQININKSDFEKLHINYIRLTKEYNDMNVIMLKQRNILNGLKIKKSKETNNEN